MVAYKQTGGKHHSVYSALQRTEEQDKNQKVEAAANG